VAFHFSDNSGLSGYRGSIARCSVRHFARRIFRRNLLSPSLKLPRDRVTRGERERERERERGRERGKERRRDALLPYALPLITS